VGLGLCLALSGCAPPVPSPESAGDTTPAPAETEPAPAEPTRSDALMPTPTELPGEMTLEVWMVEGLAPQADVPGGDVLLEQLAAFDEAHPNLTVVVRAKRGSGPGGILDYLRTAPPVAPGVLPDVALLSRADLVSAAGEKLVVPIEPLLPPDLLVDLYPVAKELGSVGGELAGLPYTLRIRHVVYRETLSREPPHSYEALLRGRNSFVFAGTATSGVNRVTLSQYLEAGGRLVDENGKPFLDAAVLTDVLTFYRKARAAGLIDPRVLQFSDPAETWAQYRDGQVGMAEVSSSDYLAERSQVRTTGLSWVPTADGKPITLVDGWMWVVVTGDPERQAAAIELIAFLMEPVNQGRFLLAAGRVPSQRTALAVWGDSDPYVKFADTLLGSGVLPPGSAIDATVGNAMQDAVEGVLLGNVSPAEAAASAAASVNVEAAEQP
jgi:ABC-type glycerol-3-phosphate transport system substrate-binding protein